MALFRGRNRCTNMDIIVVANPRYPVWVSIQASTYSHIELGRIRIMKKGRVQLLRYEVPQAVTAGLTAFRAKGAADSATYGPGCPIFYNKK